MRIAFETAKGEHIVLVDFEKKTFSYDYELRTPKVRIASTFEFENLIKTLRANNFALKL